MNRRELLRSMGGLGLLGALAGCAPSNPGLRLTIATGSTTGVYYPLGRALATAWDAELHPGAASVVRPTVGSVQNLTLLGKRQVNVAISQLDAAAVAYATDPASLRALARIYDDAVHLVVPRDSTITSLTQLRGRTVSVGAPNSGVLFTVPLLLEAIGLTVTADLTPRYLGIDESVTALRAGEIEAFFWLGGLPTDSITRLASGPPAFPIRLVNLSGVLKDVQTRYTYYSPGTVAAGVYPGTTSPITTLLVRNLLLVPSEMSDDVAHDLVEALFTDQDQIARATKAASTIDPRRAIGTQPVPLHPGAERYFREARADG